MVYSDKIVFFASAAKFRKPLLYRNHNRKYEILSLKKEFLVQPQQIKGLCESFLLYFNSKDEITLLKNIFPCLCSVSLFVYKL